MYERELEEWEYPEPDDQDDDLSATLACPACSQSIYEDSVRCPHCGDYVTGSTTSVFAGRPWWYVVLALAGVAAAIVWLAL